MRRSRRLLLLAAMVLLGLAGCGDDTAAGGTAAERTGADGAAVAGSGAPTSSAPSDDAGAQRHPDIVGVDITPAGPQTFDIAVTVSSPYDTPARYADGWRVLAPDGTELGTHTLMHDHAGEQPFTRTQPGVTIPADVDEITVEGRDQQYGFGGATISVPVPHDQG